MNKRYTTRKVENKGAALLLFVIFFLFTSSLLVIGIGRTVYDSLTDSRLFYESKRSLYAAEAGIEDAIYRHRDSRSYSNIEAFSLDSIIVSTERILIVDTFKITATANANGSVRRSVTELVIGNGASFNFGLQAGNGGIFMENNSAIRGNVFANGSVRGANNNAVYGDIISAGPSGLTDSVHATGSVWSHTITGSDIDGDAHYFNAGTISGTLVGGTSFPGSPDQPLADMPISDEMIDTWKADALAGGVIASTSPQCSTGTYTIGVDTNIGPVKIECNLTIDNNSTDVYLEGALWVEGNILVKGNPNIRVDASVTGRSVAIIADKPTNRLTSSKITLQNNAIFSGNGANSYVLLISGNTSAESGGGEVAIHMQNNATGAVLVYASHGKILVENGAALKEVTAYIIHTKNNSQITYESGLANLLFTSGPSGGFSINLWKEI